MDKCCNPSCELIAKSKCSACSLVAYCGQVCQKEDWKSHKKVCKEYLAAKASNNNSSSASASGNTDIAVAKKGSTLPASLSNLNTNSIDKLILKLQRAKAATQDAFNSQNFEISVKHGLEALKYSNSLPEPGSTIESIQIHLNMTTAYLQLKNMEEAKNHSSLCVDLAEKGLAIRRGEPQAIEMLVVALGSKSFVLMVDSKFDEADIHASRAFQMAESLFGASDLRYLFVT